MVLIIHDLEQVVLDLPMLPCKLVLMTHSIRDPASLRLDANLRRLWPAHLSDSCWTSVHLASCLILRILILLRILGIGVALGCLLSVDEAANRLLCWRLGLSRDVRHLLLGLSESLILTLASRVVHRLLQLKRDELSVQEFLDYLVSHVLPA